MFETPKPLAIRPSFYPLASKFNALCLQHHTDYYTANSNQSVTVLAFYRRTADEQIISLSHEGTNKINGLHVLVTWIGIKQQITEIMQCL